MSVCKYKFLIILIIIFLYLIYLYKNTEGFNDDFSNYTKTLPNSFIYNSARTKYNDVFSFYKGKGTYKREKIKDTGSDEKLSILNKLLDKLLNRITSDSQDCVGDFDKYSACDKLCGSGGFQTRKYVITQEKGINGKECPYEDGYEEKVSCFLKDCGEDSECERNRDCISRNCDPKDKKCGLKVECTKETTHVCDEDECRRLNEDYGNDSHILMGKYLYNKRNKQCFFKTPAEMEKLNVNLYTYNYENPDDYTYKDDTCAYYQTDQGGECVNSDKVILVDEKPKCELGWKPEPTLFNASHACQTCNVDGWKPGDPCVCPGSMVFLDNGTCGPGEANITGLCDSSEDFAEIMIKPNKDEPCQFCEYNEYFKKVSVSDPRNTESNVPVASCMPCHNGFVTERAVKWNGMEPNKKAEYLNSAVESEKENCDIDICHHFSTPDNPLEAKLQGDGSFAWPTFTNDKYVINSGDVDGSEMCKHPDPPAAACGLNMVESDSTDPCECIEGWVLSDQANMGCVRGCHARSLENSQVIPIMHAGDIIDNTSLISFCNNKNKYSNYEKLYCDAEGKLYGKEYSVHIENKLGFTPLDEDNDVSDLCLSCDAGKKVEQGACVNCPAGTHSQGGNVVECLQCPKNTYSNANQSGCIKCDPTKSSAKGSSSPEACIGYPDCKGRAGFPHTDAAQIPAATSCGQVRGCFKECTRINEKDASGVLINPCKYVPYTSEFPGKREGVNYGRQCIGDENEEKDNDIFGFGNNLYPTCDTSNICVID